MDKTENSCNSNLITSKLSYFVFFGVFGSYTTILNVFYVSVGLTATQAGVISGSRMIVSALVGPIWGFAADYSGHGHVVVPVLLSVGIFTTVLPTPWLAYRMQARCQLKQPLIENRTISTPLPVINNSIVDLPFTISSQIPANKSLPIHAVNATVHEVDAFYQQPCNTMFAAMMTAGLVSSIFDMAPRGFIDAYAMGIAVKQKANFGHQKLFAPIGYGTASFLSSYISSVYTSNTLSRFTAAFLVFLPLALSFIPSFVLLQWQFKKTPTLARSEIELMDVAVKIERKVKIEKSFLQTCCHITTATFLVTVMLVGLSCSLVIGFLFLFIERDLTTTSTAVPSFSFVASCTSEIVFYAFASNAVRVLGGPLNGILVALLSYSLRFLIFSFITNAWLVLPAQALHALGSALFWASAALYTQGVSNNVTRTTMFALVNSLFTGVGPFVGYMLGGAVLDAFDGRTLFRGASGLCFVWAVVAFFIFRASEKQELRKDENANNLNLLFGETTEK